MEKEKRKDINPVNVISDGEGSTVYELDDGRLFKDFKSIYIEDTKSVGDSVEGKIDASELIKDVEGINLPLTKIVNDDGSVTSYTMNKVEGIDLNKYSDSLGVEQLSSLIFYRDLYLKIEDLVKKLNRLGVVCPDLLTCDNIFIDRDGNIKFIDYDGLQLPGFHSIILSTSLGDPKQYFNSKYMERPFVYTKELDKNSLLRLYFLLNFNVDFNMVGCINPFSGKLITLQSLFDTIELHDDLIKHKVCCTLSESVNGVYFGGIVKKMAEMYELDVILNPLSLLKGEVMYARSLRRK